MVPEYIFSVAWLEGNFLIPSNKELRKELYRNLYTYSRYGVMFLPENNKVRMVLRARLAALEAYNA